MIKAVSLVFLLIGCVEGQSKPKTYNILALDGGGIRGLIPAQALLGIEAYAFEYATKNGYKIPQYKDKNGTIRQGVVALKDLFDMMAGTSTGSIIAAGLSYPLDDDPQTPAFFAKEVIEIYSQNGNTIFQKNTGLKAGTQAGFIILFLGIVTLTFFLLGRQIYDNPQIMERYDKALKAISDSRKRIKESIMSGTKLDPQPIEEKSMIDYSKLQSENIWTFLKKSFHFFTCYQFEKDNKPPPFYNTNEPLTWTSIGNMMIKRKLEAKKSKTTTTLIGKLAEFAKKVKFTKLEKVLEKKKEDLELQEIQNQEESKKKIVLQVSDTEQKADVDNIEIQAQEDNSAGPVGQNPPERANIYLNLPNKTPRQNALSGDMPRQNSQSIQPGIAAALGSKPITKGQIVSELIRDENLESKKAAKTMIMEMKEEYEKSRYKKWVVTLVGIIIGLIFGISIPQIYSFLTNSLYDRSYIDNLMFQLVGKRRVKEGLPDEMLIISYEYNTQQPRFFSKYFSQADIGTYDVLIADATGASSAAPVFFQPKKFTDGYGFKNVLIDGGLIGNDPALYGYFLAKYLNKKGENRFRLLSLGTGSAPNTANLKDMSKLTWLSLQADTLTDVDSQMTDAYLQMIFDQESKINNDPPIRKNYLRMQVNSTLSMDKVDPASIQSLMDAGDEMWQKNKEQVKLMIAQIIDEKFKKL